jgi:hypothetical protein
MGVAGAITNYGTAYSQSQALKAQGEAQKAYAQMNAKLAEAQAGDAIARGEREAKEHGKQVRQLVGSQRAAIAAQGIELDDGDAEALQIDTETIGAQQMLQIKNNAWREAWGFKTQASSYQAQGEMAAATARTAARSTLTTGGLQALNYGAQSYYAGQKGKK